MSTEGRPPVSHADASTLILQVLALHVASAATAGGCSGCSGWAAQPATPAARRTNATRIMRSIVDDPWIDQREACNGDRVLVYGGILGMHIVAHPSASTTDPHAANLRWVVKVDRIDRQ